MAIRSALALVGLVTALGSASAQDGWREAATGTAPEPRQGHGMAFDPHRVEVLLFGGSGRARLSDTWSWDGASWRRLTPAVSPPARSEFAMTTDFARREIVVFGGKSQSGLSDDTWIWDGRTWLLRATAHAPPARYGATLGYDEVRRRAILVGGNDNRQIFADAWEWDGSDWTQLQPALPVPPVQSSPVFFDAVGRERLLLFGNNPNTGGLVPGTWEWDGTAWVALRGPQHSPPTRTLFAAAFDRCRGRGVIFGGSRSAGVHTDDTWEWHVDHWVQRTWSTRPAARSWHAMAFDPVRGEIVLFGGADAALLNDTWLYRVAITEPASITVFGSSCAGINGAPSLTVVEGRGPWLGEDAKLVLTDLPTALFAPAFGIVGTTRGSWAGTPIPFELGRLGAPGCVLQVAVLDALLLPRSSGRAATWRIHIPDQPALVGTAFGIQGLAFDLLANPLGVVLTNAANLRIGRR